MFLGIYSFSSTKNPFEPLFSTLLFSGGIMTTKHYKIMGSYYGGRPLPVVQHDNLAHLECAVLCEATSGCVAYGYKAATVDYSSACFLTVSG